MNNASFYLTKVESKREKQTQSTNILNSVTYEIFASDTNSARKKEKKKKTKA